MSQTGVDMSRYFLKLLLTIFRRSEYKLVLLNGGDGELVGEVKSVPSLLMSSYRAPFCGIKLRIYADIEIMRAVHFSCCQTPKELLVGGYMYCGLGLELSAAAGSARGGLGRM